MRCPFCHKDTLVWQQKVDIIWDINNANKGTVLEEYICTNEKCEGTRGMNIAFPVYTRLDDTVIAEDYKGRIIAMSDMQSLIERTEEMWQPNLKREKMER